MEMAIRKHMRLLGLKVRCRVTGFEGVVRALSEDLYGCIQALVTPPAYETGKQESSQWQDVSRLEVLDATPVMEVPDFDYGPVAEGRKGPAAKPERGRG